MANPNPDQSGLKKGNTVNVGRKRNAVKLKLANGAGDSTKYINDVAAGKCVVLVPPAKKDAPPTYRYPTQTEREWAIAQQLRFGIGVSDEVDVTSGGEPVKAIIAVDLDQV